MSQKAEIKKLKSEVDALYKHLPEVIKLLQKFGCKKAVAKDLFQEAIIIYLRKREDEDFEFQLNPIHYVKQTCKFLWLNEARKEQKQQEAIASMKIEDVSTDKLEQEILYSSMEKALLKIGEKCQQLLQLFYGLGWSMVDIAKKLDLRNDKVAKAMKYRCLQKAKDLVRETQAIVEPFNLRNHE